MIYPLRRNYRRVSIIIIIETCQPSFWRDSHNLRSNLKNLARGEERIGAVMKSTLINLGYQSLEGVCVRDRCSRWQGVHVVHVAS